MMNRFTSRRFQNARIQTLALLATAGCIRSTQRSAGDAFARGRLRSYLCSVIHRDWGLIWRRFGEAGIFFEGIVTYRPWRSEDSIDEKLVGRETNVAGSRTSTPKEIAHAWTDDGRSAGRTLEAGSAITPL
jgi:hypothetical protein